MKILISMKGERIAESSSSYFDLMHVPSATKNHYFITEIREGDDEKLARIRELMPMLRDEFGGDDDFIFEPTGMGFKLKKRVDEKEDYREGWDRWVKFSQSLFAEIATTIGEEVPDFSQFWC